LKKEAKTFATVLSPTVSAFLHARVVQDTRYGGRSSKSFLVLFFKKELLP
jgi:hypothetical protein